MVARGRVIKPGKALTVCQADVYGVTAERDCGDVQQQDEGGTAATAGEVHVATLLLTMMQMQ